MAEPLSSKEVGDSKKATDAEHSDQSKISDAKPKDPHNGADSDDEVEILQYKVILLGDGAVGKTSICMRFCDNFFAASYKQTIGVDFTSKKMVLPGDVNVTLQIWDIGGQTIGSKMIRNYIYGAQAVLLCYDITNYQSFQNLSDWLTIVHKAYEGEALPYIAIVGNKADLQHLRTVKFDKHQDFMTTNKSHGFFISAKTGDQVNAIFTRIAADLAGVMLTKGQLESEAQIVKAEIINHPQNDPQTPALKIDVEKSKCIIQ